jgi:hypothetical protein
MRNAKNFAIHKYKIFVWTCQSTQENHSPLKSNFSTMNKYVGRVTFYDENGCTWLGILCEWLCVRVLTQLKFAYIHDFFDESIAFIRNMYHLICVFPFSSSRFGILQFVDVEYLKIQVFKILITCINKFRANTHTHHLPHTPHHHTHPTTTHTPPTTFFPCFWGLFQNARRGWFFYRGCVC